eukprot:s2289_g9.t1
MQIQLLEEPFAQTLSGKINIIVMSLEYVPLHNTTMESKLFSKIKTRHNLQSHHHLPVHESSRDMGSVLTARTVRNSVVRSLAKPGFTVPGSLSKKRQSTKDTAENWVVEPRK